MLILLRSHIYENADLMVENELEEFQLARTFSRIMFAKKYFVT